MNVETNIWVYIMNYPQMSTKHSQAVGVDIVALTDDASLDRFINRNHINDYRNYQCSLYLSVPYTPEITVLIKN